MEITIEKLKAFLDGIIETDSNKKDLMITYTEYKQIEKNRRVLKAISGKEDFIDWNNFKSTVQIWSEQFGISWTAIVAAYGPIKIQTFSLPKVIGLELARNSFSSIEEGDFNEIVNNSIPEINQLFSSETDIVDYSLVREGFKSFFKDNMSFRFSRGRGTVFKKVRMEYIYGNGNKKQDEIGLGNAIKQKIEELLKIKISHTQLNRTAGKYQNVDFLGYGIDSDIYHDEINIFAFELKASNLIPSISESINQAINYKQMSNYSYIIIPMFDEDVFYDNERFYTFRQLCETNGIGIISIDFTKDNAVKEVYIVLKAMRIEIEDKRVVLDFIKQQELEACPICNRIVSADEKRIGCKWIVFDKDGTANCMKLLMEKNLQNR